MEINVHGGGSAFVHGNEKQIAQVARLEFMLLCAKQKSYSKSIPWSCRPLIDNNNPIIRTVECMKPWVGLVSRLEFMGTGVRVLKIGFRACPTTMQPSQLGIQDNMSHAKPS